MFDLWLYFLFDASSSHFIFYFSPEKGDYSLSLSLFIYIYIYIYILFYNFTLGWWIIVFFIIYYFGLIQFDSVFDFLSFLSQVFSVPLLAFVYLFFYFWHNTWLFWKWDFEFMSKYNVGYVFIYLFFDVSINY